MICYIAMLCDVIWLYCIVLLCVVCQILNNGPSTLPESTVEIQYSSRVKNSSSEFTLYFTGVSVLGPENTTTVSCNLDGLINPNNLASVCARRE